MNEEKVLSKCKHNRHKWVYCEIKERHNFIVRVCSECGCIQQSKIKWDKGFSPTNSS